MKRRRLPVAQPPLSSQLPKEKTAKKSFGRHDLATARAGIRALARSHSQPPTRNRWYGQLSKMLQAPGLHKLGKAKRLAFQEVAPFEVDAHKDAL